MKYNKLISSNLKKAFNVLKSMAIDATLHKKVSTEFSFSTAITTDIILDVSTSIIVTANSKYKSTFKQSIMLLKAPIGELSVYDTITHGGNIWTLGEPLIDDGYLTLLEIYREG
jgi:hypothetical protein